MTKTWTLEEARAEMEQSEREFEKGTAFTIRGVPITRKQAREVFGLAVGPGRHWKDRINTVVTDEQLAEYPRVQAEMLLFEAVIYHVGGCEWPERVDGGWRVVSRGYWHHIGA